MGGVAERFWAKVRKTDGCWEWTGCLFQGGYGAVSYEGRKTSAHRVAWQLEVGPIPRSLCVLHTCDNRRCVRPDHLYLGSYADNARDREERRRGHDRAGARNGRAKLTPDQVREIRRLAGTMRQVDIGARFGIGQARVSAIVRGDAWQSVA